MQNPQNTTTADPQAPPEFADDLPPGNHALEIAARAGFGPLSPLVKKAWHGDAVPCVSCGQLVRREEPACDYCGQDLSEEMLEKMRAHAGPWFVLEHLRPFPGVSLERIIRQIRRGLITETSIIRGPSTDYQWRFAVETPGLCRYFGRCWHCHQQVSLSDTYCRHCLSSISFEKPPPLQALRPAPVEPAPAARMAASQPAPGPLRTPSASDGPLARPAAARPHTPFQTSAGGADASPLAPGGPAEIGDRPLTMDNREAAELARLSAAIRQANVSHRAASRDEPPRIAGIRAAWVAAALLLVAIACLLFISRARTVRPLMPPPAASPTETHPTSAAIPPSPTPPQSPDQSMAHPPGPQP